MKLSYTTLSILADGGDERAIKAKKQWLAVAIINAHTLHKSVGKKRIISAELDEKSKEIIITERGM